MGRGRGRRSHCFMNRIQQCLALVRTRQANLLIENKKGDTADAHFSGRTIAGNGLAVKLGILQMLLFFAEKNPGMTRVLLGDALLQEDDRLQERITQVLDRVEASLKQALRIAQTQGGAWAQVGQEEVSTSQSFTAECIKSFGCETLHFL